MKDVRKGPIGHPSVDIEGDMKRLAMAPIPPGLRQRVLDRGLEARANAALTPGMRVLAAACLAVIAGLAVVGPLVGRHEAARLAAVLDGRPLARQEESPAPELAEALAGDERAADRLARLEALALWAARAARPTNLIEARERLKGWLDDETSENPD